MEISCDGDSVAEGSFDMECDNVWDPVRGWDRDRDTEMESDTSALPETLDEISTLSDLLERDRVPLDKVPVLDFELDFGVLTETERLRDAVVDSVLNIETLALSLGVGDDEADCSRERLVETLRGNVIEILLDVDALSVES